MSRRLKKIKVIDPGVRDEKGHWRPTSPFTFAPVFQRPLKPLAVLKWIFSYPGYIFPENFVILVLAFVTLTFFQPNIQSCTYLGFKWISLMLLRNVILVWLVYGGFHFALYMRRFQGSERKFHPEWMSKNSKRFLFNNQVRDNVFRSFISGVPIWTAYEVLYVWAAANGKVPFISFTDHPIWFVSLFFLIPLWREVHFYFIHRLIHWGPLMRSIHSVHHKNPNPGPWSGLAMHPVEHILYFSVVAIQFIIPSSPLHFFFHSQHVGLMPSVVHTGFEGPLFKRKLAVSSYFHYLHHRFVTCTFGGTVLPLDKWFGNFHNGTGKYKASR